MAEQKSNVVEYSFQGDTLDLQKAVKRVSSLIRATVKELKAMQGGELTEDQAAQVKHLRALLKQMRTASKTSKDLTKRQQKEVITAGKFALSEALKLSKTTQKVRAKANERALQEQQKIEKLSSVAGREGARQRATYLEEYADKFRQVLSDEAYDDIIASVEGFRDALQKAGDDHAKQAEAVEDLNKVYRNYSEILQAINRSQQQASKGILTVIDLFKEAKRQALATVKTFSFWVQVIQQVIQIKKQYLSLLEDLRRSGQLNNPNMEGVREIADSWRSLTRQLSILMTNIGSIVAKVLAPVAKVLAVILGIINALLSSISDVDVLGENAYSGAGLTNLDDINSQQLTEEDQLKKLTRGWKELQDTIQPILNFASELGAVFDGLMEVITMAADAALSLFEALQPGIQVSLEAIKPLLVLLQELVSIVSTVLAPAFEVLGDVFRAVIALMTGDFELFIEYIKQAAIGLGTTILNALIAIVNIFVSLINAVVQAIGKAVETVWNPIAGAIKFFGGSDLSIDSSRWKIPSVPYLASGGVVTGPTLAVIGEGKYNEAVVPLGNSPQFTSMKEGIAEAVTRKVAVSGSSGGQTVVLQLNGKEFARAVLPDLGFTQAQTGVRLRSR